MKGKYLSLTGLVALAFLNNGCGGNIVTEPTASESEVRADMRKKFNIDRSAGRILAWEFDPVVEINSQRIFPDSKVRRNDGVEVFIEYTSPTDDSAAAGNEIRLLFNNGYNYLYISPTVREWASSAIDDYARRGYVGQIPPP